jgi:elongation factor G
MRARLAGEDRAHLQHAGQKERRDQGGRLRRHRRRLKARETKTGDTLCDPKKPVTARGIQFAPPCYAMAIAPKTKGQEDKIASGLARLSEEDLTFTFVNNAETKQLVLSARGDIQLDVLSSKLKERFRRRFRELSPARIAYREKIRKKVQARGRHKKQSRLATASSATSSSISSRAKKRISRSKRRSSAAACRRTFPGRRKGPAESIQKGVLAAIRLVQLKATLVDGSYHPVDSSEMAFKTAAQLAYKEGIPQASPVILEPIGYLKVTIPDTYMGDIMSDLSKRRGSPMGMNLDADGNQIVEAEVPMGEMSGYAIDLRSMTQGRGVSCFYSTV